MSSLPKPISFGYIAKVVRYPGKGKRHFFIIEFLDGEHEGEESICNLNCDWIFDLPLDSYIYVKRNVRIEPGQMFVDMISLAAQTPDVKQMAFELGIEIPSLNTSVEPAFGAESFVVSGHSSVEVQQASSIPGPTGGSHTFNPYQRDQIQHRIQSLGICAPEDARRGGKYLKYLVEKDLASQM